MQSLPDRPTWRYAGYRPADAGQRVRRLGASGRGTDGSFPASTAPNGDELRGYTLRNTLSSARDRGNAGLRQRGLRFVHGRNPDQPGRLRWHTPAAMIRTPEPRRRGCVNATTMRALVLRRHGGLSDLEVVDDYPVPRATEGQVVIRVRASSFNYHDVFTMRGMPGIK